MPARDRDERGRARNARARDSLGRPLARSVGSGGAAGVASGVERVPDELGLGVDDAIDLAQSYLDNGLPFHAHEVFEAIWKTGDPAERDLWQGLAQIAVGLTHALRGNSTGAVALLTRGADRVERYVGDTHGIAVAGVVEWVAAALRALDQRHPIGATAIRLRG